MARGKTISIRDMYVRGGTNFLTGSDYDDDVTIRCSMNACKGATNHIVLGYGNDTVAIHGSMQGAGSNVIEGAFGDKNLTLNGGMRGSSGSYNKIFFNGQTTDTHNMTIGTVTTGKNSVNEIVTTDGTDYLNFTNSFTASCGGRNSVQLGDGEKHVAFNYGMTANSNSTNEISFGIGNHVLDSKSMSACGGINRISSMAGDNFINIKGAMSGSGSNEIILGYGQHNISIGSIASSCKGSSNITTEGDTNLSVNGHVSASNSYNQINTGFGDDSIYIQGDLSASCKGNNTISTGEGNDFVVINGWMTASNAKNYINTGEGDDYIAVRRGVSSVCHGSNVIQAGEGNDIIQLSDSIGRGALEINGGGGYDTLILSANRLSSFNCDYKNWFTDMSTGDGLTATSIEAVQVDIGQNFNLGKVDWLTQILNNHNSINPNNHIDMEVNVDSFGQHITVGSLFSNADESAINLLDLSGGNSNTLEIRSSLQSGGYDNQTLHIKGDSNDTVTFDLLWQDSGFTTDQNTGVDYHVFSNAYGEDVMVQAGMNILYV